MPRHRAAPAMRGLAAAANHRFAACHGLAAVPLVSREARAYAPLLPTSLRKVLQPPFPPTDSEIHSSLPPKAPTARASAISAWVPAAPGFPSANPRARNI